MVSEAVVFLLDVDNTLLDNDRVLEDLHAHLQREFGPESSARYWEIFERLRAELGYADYLGALQRYRHEAEDDPRLPKVSFFLLDYPFESRVFDSALDVLRRLGAAGPTVILSDGDVVFQPHKIRRSGLWDAVDGRVLVYTHKERMLAAIKERFPARHYVMVDDKLRILSAMKAAWGDQLTTVFARQGHYALDRATIARYPPADVTLERIADLLRTPLSALDAAAGPRA